MTITISRELVRWAHDLRWTDAPDDVRTLIKLQFADALGVAVAAGRLGTAPWATSVAGFGEGDEARVIGEPGMRSAMQSAFTNGALIHALDFDDTHTRGLVHVSAVCVPAVLSVAEMMRLTGEEALLADLVASEVIARLGAASPHGFHTRGFHATGVCGTIAAALACALGLGLSEDEAVGAIGIAGSMASGSMEFLATGAATKQVHPGWAAMSGLMAARLAQAGASGPDSIIEGGHGLYRLYSDVSADLASITAGLGELWEVRGIAMKPYPACHLLHATLDAAASIRAQLRLDAVDDILVRIPADSVPIVCAPQENKRRPRTPYEAKFSVQWTLAAMLVDGAVDIDTFLPERLDRADLAALSDKVRYEPIQHEGAAADTPGDIDVSLGDGRVIHSLADHSSGPPAREAAVSQKFSRNVGGDERAAEALLDLIRALDRAEDVGGVLDGLEQLAACSGGARMSSVRGRGRDEF